MIAIVDDDIAVGQATQTLLKSLAYSARCFSSGEEFLDCRCMEEVTCVISDVQMPGMSGIELQVRLIADGHRVPIIFVTGFPDDEVRKRVTAAGASGYFVKTYQQQDLLDCLA